MGGYKWTKEEISKLKKVYHNHTNKELAKIFNRNSGAICSKANKIGLHKSKKHLSENSSKIMEGNDYRKGKTFTEKTKNKISKSMKKARADIKDKINRRKTWNNMSQKEKNNITVQSVKAMQKFWDNLSYGDSNSVNLEQVSFEQLFDHEKPSTILELDLRQKTGCTIIGFKSADGEYIVNPNPKIQLTPNSKIIVIGNSDQIKTLQEVYSI